MAHGRLKEHDPDGIAIVDAALMIESGGYKRFDKMIVVWCEYCDTITAIDVTQ